MGFTLPLFFGALLCDHAAAASSVPQRSWKEVVVETENVLRKDCGEECIKVLHSLLASPELQNATADTRGGTSLRYVADHLSEQVSYVSRLRDSFADSGEKTKEMGRVRQHTTLDTKAALADTPCNSQASCSLAALAANKCSYMRQGMQRAYQGLNVVVHVMGALVTVLCGCIFVFTQAKCVLSFVPPVCIRPYSVYSKAFSGSVQMWESVKSMTKTCIMHGSPMISS